MEVYFNVLIRIRTAPNILISSVCWLRNFSCKLEVLVVIWLSDHF